MNGVSYVFKLCMVVCIYRTVVLYSLETKVWTDWCTRPCQ